MIGFMPFLIQIVIALVVIGLVLWIVEQIPMDATIARIIRVVIIVAVCLWLLNLLVPMIGSGSYLGHYPHR